MRTMHPSIMIGSYGWEQDRVPRDEFQIRLDALHGVMDEKGLAAALIYGDAREHSALAWFANFIPRMRWAMALLPRKGEPRLLTSMSPRDVPAMRQMTWIGDVMSGWNWASAFDPWLAKLGTGAPAEIGSLGFELMRPPLMQSLEQSLGNRFRLKAADDDVQLVLTRRPREVSLVREACGVVAAGAAAMRNAWRDGRGNEAAALEGERVARAMAAQDVRTLVSFDGGRTLSPFRGTFEARVEPFLGYIAVKHMGYWAELFVSEIDRRSEVARAGDAGLSALLTSVNPGARAGVIQQAAIQALGSYSLHPVLAGSAGRRTGLSPNEGGELRANGAHALGAGEIYALHVGAHDPQTGGAIASAMIRITSDGCEVLVRSDEA
jgi:Xaa-Pro aminopeptidase